MKPDVWIITGSQKKGKTVLILAIKKHLTEKHIPVCGVVSPGVYFQTKREKIIAQNVENDETHELAKYSPGWDAAMPEKIWKMDEEGILWGNTQLDFCEPRGKVFLLDEIGIYELLEGKGWQAGLEILKNKQYRRAIVTVRKELFSALIKICENVHISYEIVDLDQFEGKKQVVLDTICASLFEKL